MANHRRVGIALAAVGAVVLLVGIVWSVFPQRPAPAPAARSGPAQAPAAQRQEPTALAELEPATPVVTVAPSELSIVVMPFANMSGDRQQQYFSDAVTEEVAAELTRIDRAFVIDRDTAFSLRGRPFDPRQVGKQFSVRYVLEGSVWRIGDYLRITLLLIDNETQLDVWSEFYQVPRDLLPRLPNTVATRLAQSLRLGIAPAPADRPDPGATAVDLFRRGRAETIAEGVQTRESYRAARDLLERAVRESPDFAAAQTWLARVLAAMLANGWSDAPDADAVRAQSLLDALQRAGVDSVDRRVAQGILRRLQGRLDDAIKELELAVALGRNDLSGNFELAATLVLAGRPQDAIPRLQAALRLNPAGTFAALQHDSWSAAVDLAAAFGMRGDIDDGKAALAAARRINPALTSIAVARASESGSGGPRYIELRQATLDAGLRKLGVEER
jgi:TolB-like protein